MAEDALSKFSSAVLSEAGAQKEELIRQMKKEREQKLEQKQAELDAWEWKTLESGKMKLNRDIALSVSRHRAELRRSLFESRTKMVEAIFAEVEKNVRAFTESEKYDDYLQHCLESTLPQFQTGQTVCYVRPQDMEKVRSMCGGKAAVAETEKDIIGGILFRNEELKLCVDGTLLARLDAEKENFFETSGMIVE